MLANDQARLLRAVRPAWRQDLKDWKWRAAGIPAISSVEEALQQMRLTSSGPVSGAERFLSPRSESAPNVQAGRVAIPQFGTLKSLSEHASPLHLRPIAPAQEERDTKPFPILTGEYSEAMLAARTYGGYSPWAAVAEAGAQLGKQRLGTVVSRLVNARSWRRGLAQSTPLREPQPIEREREAVVESAPS